MTAVRSAGRWRRVVVGVDGSPNSLAAMRRAVYQARQRGAGIELVHVVPADSGAEAAATGHAMLGMAVRCEIPGGLGVPARFTVDWGDPAETLVRRSEGAELLVIGARSLRDDWELLGEDVVRYCVRRSSCPVDICAEQRVHSHPADLASIG
jgi:nucleotide-binding universal stress UspA family protein